MNAILIIDKNIAHFQQLIDDNDMFAKITFYSILGKVNMAVELGALTFDQAKDYIDTLFELNSHIT